MTARASAAGHGVAPSRFGRLLLGYVAACATVSVTFVWPALLLGLIYAHNWTLEHLALFAIGPAFVFLFVLVLALVPFLLWSIASERWSLRRRAAHMLAGFLTCLPVWAIYAGSRFSGEAPAAHPVWDSLFALAWIGSAALPGGYVYWRLSGRHAGSARRRRPA